MKQVEISESDNPSKERIWDKMYQCRDLELSSFWQKSLFLFGFMSLCFAGYSGLFMHSINTDKDLPSFSPIYIFMSVIALLGIIMSVLWVFMTKGSKAWYEVYEKSIYAIESEIFKRNNKKYVMGEWAKRMKNDYDLALWTGKPGSFSPSKINMVIGKIMIIVWTLCEIYSIINCIKVNFQDDWLMCLMIAVITFIISCFLIPFLIRPYVKSSPLLPHYLHKTGILFAWQDFKYKPNTSTIRKKMEEYLITKINSNTKTLTDFVKKEKDDFFTFMTTEFELEDYDKLLEEEKTAYKEQLLELFLREWFKDLQEANQSTENQTN